VNQLQVTIRTNSKGKVIPLRINWEGKELSILGIGRRWYLEDGEHILVMIPGDRVVELVYRQDNTWALRPIPSQGEHWFV
jgi:hypothetical protein